MAKKESNGLVPTGGKVVDSIPPRSRGRIRDEAWTTAWAEELNKLNPGDTLAFENLNKGMSLAQKLKNNFDNVNVETRNINQEAKTCDVYIQVVA